MKDSDRVKTVLFMKQFPWVRRYCDPLSGQNVPRHEIANAMTNTQNLEFAGICKDAPDPIRLLERIPLKCNYGVGTWCLGYQENSAFIFIDKNGEKVSPERKPGLLSWILRRGKKISLAGSLYRLRDRVKDVKYVLMLDRFPDRRIVQAVVYEAERSFGDLMGDFVITESDGLITARDFWEIWTK